MSDKSNDQGRAYEYICLITLAEVISEKRPVKIIENSSLEAAKDAWNKVDANLQDNLKLSANAAVKTLCDLEMRMIEDGDDILELSIQKDDKGESGDVRDILVIRRDIRWEIGLSLKHNHFAVKHSRLSRTLDFGEKWYDIQCSKQYWEMVAPVFAELEEAKANGKLWREVAQKAERVYLPLLEAFKTEVKLRYAEDPSMAKRLAEYLIGKYDFYKVISIDRKRETCIQPVNIHGTLGDKPEGTTSTKEYISIPLTMLPDEIVDIRMKTGSDNTLELYMNNGWQFNLRIHSAATKVETSLKFDVQAIGVPATIISINTEWEEV